MAPKSATDTVSNDDDHLLDEQSKSVDSFATNEYKRRIVWKNVVVYVVLHTMALYGFYLLITKAYWSTVVWSYLLYVIGGLGITAGAHRLWSHKTYKANVPMRIILMIFNCVALQNDVIEWARDHRVHHKYSETDADPHNATRGFFFSHVGWLLVRKHPEVIRKGKQIDLTDLYNDPVLIFQRKYYPTLVILFCFIVPVFVPILIWKEGFLVSFLTAGVFRYVWNLNWTWTINSVAHMFGGRPYDENINPRQNRLASFWSLGEGWHNYHHVFPWDYRASEWPYTLNLTTLFIDFFALIGWAYDRKVVSEEMIQKKKLKSGEKSDQHPDELGY